MTEPAPARDLEALEAAPAVRGEHDRLLLRELLRIRRFEERCVQLYSAASIRGMVGVHPTVRATLAADHRATDGHEGSRFLAAVDRLLQTPEEL